MDWCKNRPSKYRYICTVVGRLFPRREGCTFIWAEAFPLFSRLSICQDMYWRWAASPRRMAQGLSPPFRCYTCPALNPVLFSQTWTCALRNIKSKSLCPIRSAWGAGHVFVLGGFKGSTKNWIFKPVFFLSKNCSDFIITTTIITSSSMGDMINLDMLREGTDRVVTTHSGTRREGKEDGNMPLKQARVFTYRHFLRTATGLMISSQDVCCLYRTPIGCLLGWVVFIHFFVFRWLLP